MRVNKTSNISFMGFYPPKFSSFVEQILNQKLEKQPTQDEFTKMVPEPEPKPQDLDDLP